MTPWQVEFSEHSQFTAPIVIKKGGMAATIPIHGDEFPHLFMTSKTNPETGSELLIIQEESHEPDMQLVQTDIWAPSQSPVKDSGLLMWDILQIVYVDEVNQPFGN